MVELTLKQNVIELLNKHIDRCRKAVSECPKWSPAQAEWSRARDALLNFGDDLARIDTPPSSSTEICPDCNGAGGDNQYWRCARCNGSGGIPPSSTPEVVEAVARALARSDLRLLIAPSGAKAIRCAKCGKHPRSITGCRNCDEETAQSPSGVSK